MSIAERLINSYLDERAPKEPYLRALHRIQGLIDRFDDYDKVIKHTMLRLSKTDNINKIEGLYLAAKDLGLTTVAKAARQKFKQMTGGWPREL